MYFRACPNIEAPSNVFIPICARIHMQMGKTPHNQYQHFLPSHKWMNCITRSSSLILVGPMKARHAAASKDFLWYQ